MSRWTAREIYEAFANNPRIGADRVHWQSRIPFAGRPGHYYIFRRRRQPITFEQLARITRLSGNAEVTLTRMNDTFIVFIGNTGVATSTVAVPSRQEGIEEFEWIAHTHPLEQENEHQRVPRRQTRQDELALNVCHERWGQRESSVVVTRGGRVESVVRFSPVSDESPTRGGLFTPDLN